MSGPSDAWLTRDPPMGDDGLAEAWYAFVDGAWTPDVPEAACEEDHPDHAIYEAWEKLALLIDRREARLEEDSITEYLDRAAATTEAP